MSHLEVLIAGSDADAHCGAVRDRLLERGVRVVCVDADTVLGSRIAWAGGAETILRTDAGRWVVSDRTTVWWRRPGQPSTPSMSLDESRFVREEVAAIWPGVLEASGVRWVDAPWVLVKARLKPVQLAAASELGVAVPASLVSGDVYAAEDFASNREVVAKASSSGRGIAPFVDVVPAAALGRLAACPALVQERVDASADIRVVTVGTHAETWVRPRPKELVDWRAADPAGAQFVHVDEDLTSGMACAIAEKLGLTMSVQDWLLRGDGTVVFLEVNPQGQFLFLRGADALVIGSICEHLG